MSEVGNLRNSFGRTDKAEYIFKRFKHRLRVIPRQRTFKSFTDSPILFYLDAQKLDIDNLSKPGLPKLGTMVLGINYMRSNINILDYAIYKHNDNNTFKETFESSTFMDTVDWTFDRTANTITVTTNDLVIDRIVEDQAMYETVTISVEGENTDITALDLYIVTADLIEHPIAWDGTITFTPTTKFGLKIKNTGVAFTTNMFTTIGKPMILNISYA